MTIPASCALPENQPHLHARAIPTQDLQALFELCNERYFDGYLVPSSGFRLRFSRSVKLSGCFHYCLASSEDWGIDISQRLKDHPFALLSTMVHEMIHMLAHQLFRETGSREYLDEQALPGQPFTNRGHGAFFMACLERLNQRFAELRITIKSTFGDSLYDLSKISRERLLLISIRDASIAGASNPEQSSSKGMIYRLDPKAELDWDRLAKTAEELHGSREIRVLSVAGHRAEGFPVLRRDNGARRNMRLRSLRNFSAKVMMLLDAPQTDELREAPRSPSLKTAV
ncbi:SprT-like domain-containing protein [Marinobacter salicampi]|uniref:SprT-like domain-containing protein n=1 Tax=Marinobacter salicampi TaxID=435907 RepID=UPI00140D4F69|nr:SprT-like domain-containing protein [Marinobacter salicampi]